MKTNRLLVFLTFTILLGFYGCAPVYIPNVVNTPMLSNKGELQAAVYTGVTGFDPQFAYAITNNLGVMLNASFANKTNDTLNNFHKHQFVETGVGYFTKIGESGRFETFGGIGYAKLKSDYSNNLWISYTDLYSYRLFLQPSIGAATDFFDGSFSTRFVYLSLFQNNLNYNAFFIEPVITAKVGYKYVKAVFQLGFSFPVNSNEIIFSYQPLLFSIGIQAKINTIPKK